MGIFSTNRYSSAYTDVDIVAAEGYHGEIGAAIALIEGYQNDMALFNGIISADFQEACLVQEGASSDEIYILQEGALKGAWEKIIQFFKKLGEKIKGIFHAFIAKMDSIFMKDANAFYKKYIKDINQKRSWEGFKCKVKPVNVSSKEVAVGFSVTGMKLDSSSDAKKEIEDWDSEKEYDKQVQAFVSTIRKSSIDNSEEFKKAYREYVFDDEETKDDWTSSDITDGYIGSFLKDKETLRGIERANRDTEKAIKNIIAAIEKEKDDLAKIDRSEYEKKGRGKNKSSVDQIRSTISYGIGSKEINKEETDKDGNTTQGDLISRDKGELDKYADKVSLTHKRAIVIQNVFNDYASCVIECYKECCAQARRVYAAAVAFGPKKEDAVLAQAEGDVAYYEACDLIDTMYDIAD